MVEFNGLEYTRKEAAKQLLKIEEHSTNGSALEAGCSCIEERHMLSVEGYGDEGQVLAKDPREKEFWNHVSMWARSEMEQIYKTPKNPALYKQLADAARHIRVNLQDENWAFPVVLGNPRGRAFLPHGLTACEKSHPEVRAMLKRCIKEAEINCCGKATKDYSSCTCNPIAVCRASVACP